METRIIYCSACDREVRVVLRTEGEAAGQPPSLEGALCLDIGTTCSGSTCPVCAVSAERIRGDLLALGNDL